MEFIVQFQNSVYRLVTHLVFYYHLQSFLNYSLRLRQVELPPIELRDQVFRIKDGVPLSPYPSPKSRTTGPLVIFGKNLGLRRELRMRKKTTNIECAHWGSNPEPLERFLYQSAAFSPMGVANATLWTTKPHYMEQYIDKINFISNLLLPKPRPKFTCIIYLLI